MKFFIHVLAAVTSLMVCDPDEPSITGLTVASHSAILKWTLGPYAQNRCNVTGLNVYTKDIELGTVDYIKIPIKDNILRPDVVVDLTGLRCGTRYTIYANSIGYAVWSKSKNVTVNFKTELNYSLTDVISDWFNSLGFKIRRILSEQY
ncbi:hypothetical protein ABEB36_001143 [Hypothenemus hampei]|uniref:Fibronectin type-III domain-containing protein n=1 Tax=Hypothenemus hampei TaxID=57062 RepID=A0ABD1FFH4_HYPHA